VASLLKGRCNRRCLSRVAALARFSSRFALMARLVAPCARPAPIRVSFRGPHEKPSVGFFCILDGHAGEVWIIDQTSCV
jgi:hypothetical protein